MSARTPRSAGGDSPLARLGRRHKASPGPAAMWAETMSQRCAKGQGSVSITGFVKDVTHIESRFLCSLGSDRRTVVGLQEGRPTSISGDLPLSFRSEHALVGLSVHDQDDCDLRPAVIDNLCATVPFVAVRIPQRGSQAAVSEFAAMSASIMINDQSHDRPSFSSRPLRSPTEPLLAIVAHKTGVAVAWPQSNLDSFNRRSAGGHPPCLTLCRGVGIAVRVEHDGPDRQLSGPDAHAPPPASTCGDPFERAEGGWETVKWGKICDWPARTGIFLGKGRRGGRSSRRTPAAALRARERPAR